MIRYAYHKRVLIEIQEKRQVANHYDTHIRSGYKLILNISNCEIFLRTTGYIKSPADYNKNRNLM
jgi:hypothetical protein